MMTNVPTPEHERDEAMPSDLGERKEVILNQIFRRF